MHDTGEKLELHPSSWTRGELYLPAMNGVVAAVCRQLL